MLGASGLLRAAARLAGLSLALTALACGGEDTKRSLDPVQVAMNAEVAPLYEGEELSLYEVRRGIQFPIAAPSEADLSALAGKAVAPFARYPFITSDQIEVQVTWTLSNLDADARNVMILIDPWNEFGKYSPGLQVIDAAEGEVYPNASGIEILMELPGTEDGRSSRKHGTFTIEDMNELAIDFATAMNLIANPPSEEEGPLAYVNHAFAREQRSNRDVLSRPFIPSVIPGLTGIDIGIRTFEQANIALEVVVEVIDKDSGKVLEEGSDEKPMAEPTEVISIGYEAM
ncbi:MAG TPA: hypothetical protein VK524_12340 [Polyangiaceae bacterium]|nr:hypothetical protein [Polyangiaceae bacterium]